MSPRTCCGVSCQWMEMPQQVRHDKIMTTKHILLLPGDGIGPEVVAETVKVINWFSEHGPLTFTTSNALIGGAAYDAVGTPFPDDTLAQAKKADAILLGAVG